MDEHERWSFHLEYLKVAITISTAVLAAAAAIFVDASKIPGGGAGRLLFLAVAGFAAMLLASAASLGLLASHLVKFQPPAAGATPPVSRDARVALHCANLSFVALMAGGVCLASFFGLRTIEADGDGFSRALALARASLPLDAAKNETAALKSAALVGDAYEFAFSLSPGGGAANVTTDAAGRQLRLVKRP